MNLKIILATGALALASLSATPALACKCRQVSMQAAMGSASYVFDGRVLRVRREGASVYADIETSRVLKGSVPRVVEIGTPASAAACGYAFKPGQALTIGAEFSQQQFTTTSCIMTALNPGR